ncbi:NPH3 domain-containing protein [Heracleum sosnowskyi]|uniref:NPH3 domain-containing protein n=1 Tax=Heracleum sosnowskyi TaxID=360622 RepID=A0AAD8ML74_9APIA|nr:NPH3 domain-containing protein [Heracleum sosnowskyi]
MKFMKLGSRPDTFYTNDSVRSVSSEVSSDVMIQVKGTRYLLHKFPLLSKCLRLQKLCSEAPESSQHQIIQLPDFPGGIEAFEICAKFCYGITITLSAYNIVSARCAAEYLQMNEDVEKGNLMYKLEIFLNSCVLQGWKDSVVALHSTKGLPLWAEDLGITSRCIEAIASKVLSNPSKSNLSHSYSRRGRDDTLSCNGAESHRSKHVSKGWWAEDVAELGIDLYWRTMIAIKSRGKVPSNLIGDALRIYASRWLPNISKRLYAEKQVETDHGSDSVNELTSKHRLLLESIISLLPVDRSAVSCGFLLKLLKAANILKASSSSKMELARRVGIQLEEATVGDLLIPNMSHTQETQYDVDIVITILEQFMLQGQSPPTSPPRAKGGFQRQRSRSAENIDFEFQESRRSSSASHSSKLKVAKLVDGYLQVVAREANLPLSKFLQIAEALPGFARLDHDDLYRAIDIYLKGHLELNKTERKLLCRVLDCKKLSMEACTHAAQNELLPLRVVVQVLFFEQARAAMHGGQVTNLPENIKALLASHNDSSRPLGSLVTSKTLRADDQWSMSGLRTPNSNISTLKMKLAENEELDDNYANGIEKSPKFNPICALPNRPKRMFSKLWSINRHGSEKG